jgi:hypothetical protein
MYERIQSDLELAIGAEVIMRGSVILRLLLAGATLGWSAGTTPGRASGQDPARKANEPKGMRIVISDESVILDGQAMALPMPVKQLIALLGKPSRESRLANTVLTWDQLGMYAYVDPSSESVNAINIVFRREAYEFVPQKTFDGRVTIDEADLKAGSTVDEINAAGGGKAFRISRPGLWTREQGGVLLFLAIPRDGKPGIVYLAIEAGEAADELPSAPARSAAAGESEAHVVARGVALDQLVGEWSLDGFVVSRIKGSMSIAGVGGFSGPTCGDVTVAGSDDRTISLTASCEAEGDYSFRLTHGGKPESYLMTVKSAHGISISDFPVSYVEGQGWQGVRDQTVGGETMSITAAISPIEGRNWLGWRIQVLPPAVTSKDAKPQDLKEPYFMADLTRRK